MSCEQYAASVADHACGGDLSLAVRTHLSGCAACTTLLEAQRRAMGDLDNELRVAVAIDPSPNFAARVREEIASSRKGTAWWWPPLAAAATVAVIAVGAWNLRQWQVVPVTAPSPPPATAAENREATEGSVIAALPATPRDRPTPPSRGVRRAVRAARRAPEVLVSTDQRAALERYMELLRSGRLDALALDSAIEPIGSDLTVAPITVEPLSVTALETGVPTGSHSEMAPMTNQTTNKEQKQ